MTFLSRFKPIFAWYDFWIGLYFDTRKKYLYIFPAPMLGVCIDLSTQGRYIGRTTKYDKDLVEIVGYNPTTHTAALRITAAADTAPDTSMDLPAGKTCADCVHLPRCHDVLGCTTPDSLSCDFYPSLFKDKGELQ